MMVITGAAGFIGSCLAHYYAAQGYDLLLVDDFSRPNKWNNLNGLDRFKRADRTDYIAQPAAYGVPELMLHIGARTDTTEFDENIFNALNLSYSKAIWNFCSEFEIPLIYASSAATFGDGAHGFSDSHNIVPLLRPLNPYGKSKQDMDLWVLEQKNHPPFWAGLKFFNVYGPNEYHKGRMASVIFHTWQQVKQNGSVKLFRSRKEEYRDGMQLRDFIYVGDIIELIDTLIKRKPESGLYNCGTGEARSFLDLATAVFKAIGKEPRIEFIDIPEDIRDNYQYFTEADMSKWKLKGILPNLHTLEDSVSTYVGKYLSSMRYYEPD